MKEFYDLKMIGTQSRQNYLNQTDWLVIRESESAVLLDQATKDKRQQAREEISLLRDSTEWSEIQHLTKEF